MFRLNRVFIGLFGLAFATLAVENGLHSEGIAAILFPAVAALWLVSLSIAGPRHHRMGGFAGCHRGAAQPPAQP